MRALFPLTGTAHRVGLTGPPGAGKSTVADRLIRHFRERQARVGVVAVDPSSPFTGGALLGDRVRMDAAVGDRDVFIRSMATRGSLGGLCNAAEDALDLMDAAGFDPVLVETVGVGQVELDVARAADTVVVVLVPESGDGVQAMKAGLMEIGDIFVVNKADREGADRLKQELESILGLRPSGGWRPRVVAVSAKDNQGYPSLFNALQAHRDALTGDALAEKRLQAARERILNTARRVLLDGQDRASAITLETLAQAVVTRTLCPYDAAHELIQGNQ